MEQQQQQYMEQIAKAINGKWVQDHTQNENYDDFLREQGMPWFTRKMVQVFKISRVEEWIVNGDQITYRQYVDQNRTSGMTLTVGQPPIDCHIEGFGHFQVSFIFGDASACDPSVTLITAAGYFRVESQQQTSNMEKKNMEQIAQQLNGRWKQDHSQNENYDLFLRDLGVPWFFRKLVTLFKISPVEEYIFTGDQITYRQYANRNRPFEMTLTVGQPPVTITPASGISFQGCFRVRESQQTFDMEQNMHQLAQLNGRWKQDHSQNENYDDFLREQGVPWFARKIVTLFKMSPVEEYIVTGNQITYRQYQNQYGRVTFEMTLTVGQPPVHIATGFTHFQYIYSRRLS
uniref:Uncharacterized protein n=1 Tax=Branchiostoma floridae TaxID=7739 RepID=C3ZQR5_BRAFL|eukprot:XP_002589100.1 hypothetical protein BRAFLDRAFT_120907 [Branchiostoma floridae]